MAFGRSPGRPAVSAPAVELQDLGKHFRNRRPWRELLKRARQPPIIALAGLTITVPEGEFFGLLGENGAGKTTLFKLLSTLVVPDAGRAAIFGADVVRSPAAVRRLLAPVFTSDRSLYWRLTATENLRLYAALYRLPANQVESRITELLSLVGLAQTGSRLVGTFSSGMKQRLLLARALLARPRLLLLDEPTRSLDPIAARDFREFLRREIGHSQGCTVVLATHDPDEVRDLCDRVAVLHRGKLMAQGKVSSLAAQLGYERYRVVTTAPAHAALEGLADQGVRLGPVPSAEPNAGEQWQSRDLDLTGGHPAAAAILARLRDAGVPVASFGRVELPLAELIERLSRGAGGESDA